MLPTQVPSDLWSYASAILDDPGFFKIEKFAPHFIAHSFRVHTDADLDQDVQRWLRESYDVGAQKHVKRRRMGRMSW